MGHASPARGKMTGPLQSHRCTFILFDILNGSRSRSIRRVLLETAAVDPREPGAMTRSSLYLRPAPVPAGVLLTLLALGITARPVRGRLLASRHIPGRSATLLGRRSRGCEPGRASDPLPVPEGPRPCSGAFCSGQPAAPAVPAGVADARVGSWAWCPAIPGSAATGASFLSLETNDPRPLHRWIAVFRPPRLSHRLDERVQRRPGTGVLPRSIPAGSRAAGSVARGRSPRADTAVTPPTCRGIITNRCPDSRRDRSAPIALVSPAGERRSGCAPAIAIRPIPHQMADPGWFTLDSTRRFDP